MLPVQWSKFARKKQGKKVGRGGWRGMRKAAFQERGKAKGKIFFFALRFVVQNA